MEGEGPRKVCRECKKQTYKWSRCRKCGGTFCLKHAGSRNHECIGRKQGAEGHGASRRRLLISVVGVSVLAIFAVLVLFGQRWNQRSEAASWIYSDKLRAGYTSDPTKYLDDISSAGLNSIVYNIQRVDPKEMPLEMLEEVARACSNNGIHLFVSVYWLLRSYLAEGDWMDSVTKDGFVDDYAPPCPLDEGYVNSIIAPQTLALASISKEFGIEGVLYDAELYGAWPVRYHNATCFCDDCFYGFMRRIGRQDTVEKNNRYSWLVDAGALDQYYAYLRERVASMLSKVAREARMSNPDLIFGVLGNFFDNWYTEAMAQAFSTRHLPFLILDEGTYRFGYSHLFGWDRKPIYKITPGMTYAEFQATRIKKSSLNVAWAGGIEILRWQYPITIPYHMCNLALKGGGYWLFWLSPQTTTPDWLKAYRTANDEIDLALREGDLSSPFSFNPNVFDPVELLSEVDRVGEVVPSNQGEPDGKKEVNLAGLNTAVLFDERPKVRLEVVSGDGHPCLAAMFDSRGYVIDSIEIPPGTIGEIQSKEPIAFHPDGTIPLPTLARFNSSLPYTISVGPAPWALVQPVTVAHDMKLYWMPPENQTTFQIFCTGRGIESASIEISCEGVTVANLSARETLSFPILQIPEPHRVFKVEIRNVEDPITLSLKSWAPYLAVSEGNVLIAKKSEE